MEFTSTRGLVGITAGEAVLNGTAEGGGLYVPTSFPVFSADEIAGLCSLSYAERVATVLQKFFTDFSFYELLDYAEKAYSTFDEPCPVVKLEDGSFVAELWHGPTSTCKDMSFALLPYLITAAKRKLGIKTKSLAVFATSGNTGKAALESFTAEGGTELVVAYPDAVMDYLQKLQLVTHVGKNAHVFGVQGSFAEVKNELNKLLSDKANKKTLAECGFEQIDVSSVNWGRLCAQIAYCFSVYADLTASGEIDKGQKINCCVTASSGSQLAAAYYAKKMGLPIDRIIVAVNENNGLAEFFNTGTYRPSQTVSTNTPSLDANRCRNLERIVFEICGRDAEFVKNKMDEFEKTGILKVDAKLLKDCDIVCGYATHDEIIDTIEGEFEENDYVPDPHTAAALSVWIDYLTQAEDETVTVVFGTASPFRYPTDVLFAISEDYVRDPIKAIKKLEDATALDAPEALKRLKNLPIVHNKIVDLADARATVLNFIK